ncbi:copper resistance CopC family protein [Trujillonella humicola]|uniref:copper resistance CopC family protein n=1 Tax=Trujillonella humicola TaxID=3383699 RepID=UPI0039064C3B
MDHQRNDLARRLRRRAGLLLGAVATLLALALAGAPAAAAHDELTAAAPADGASVTTAPAEVALEFSGVVQELGAQVVVTGPDGTPVGRGEPRVVDRTLTQPLADRLPGGTYAVRWRVTSADGHPVSGTTTFTVTTGEAPAPVQEASAAAPAGSSSTSGPWLGIGAGAVLLVALGVAVRQLRGRS